MCPAGTFGCRALYAEARTIRPYMKSSHPEIDHIGAFLEKLMPGSSDAEREEAKQRLIRYVAIVARIHKRIEREQDADSRKMGVFDRFGGI